MLANGGAHLVKGRFYRNSLVLILIISSVPGIVFGGILYWLTGERMEKALLQLHNNQIMQSSISMDEQFSLIEAYVAHWAFDPKWTSSLPEMNFGYEFETARDITRGVGAMSGSTPLTKQAAILLKGTTRYVQFNPQYGIVDAPDLTNMYDQLFASEKRFFWTNLPVDPANPERKDVTLVHLVTGENVRPFGMILVRLSEDKVSDLLKSLLPYNVGQAFIIQRDGNILLSSDKKSETVLFQQQLADEVRQKEAATGSFVYEKNNETHTVSYRTFSRIGTEWVFVSVSPISVITKPVATISKIILISSIASLLLAFVLSWFASRRIYSPIGRLMYMLTGNESWSGSPFETTDEFKLIEKEWLHLTRESITLQNRLEQQLSHVQEGFLLQLLQGYLYSYSEKDLLDRMRGFGWDVDDKQFVVMQIHLTGFANLEGRFSQGDEGLVTFAAANIVHELALNRLSHADVINFHDLSLGLLMIMPSEQAYKETLLTLSDELMQAINRILKLKVSIAIGKATDSVADIPIQYEQAKQAIGYRRFENENQIIDLDSLFVDSSKSENMYPFVLEREIIQMIRTGQQQEAEQAIGAFLEALLERGAKEIDVQQGMLQLLGSILHAVRTSGIDPNRIFHSANLYEQLTQIREPQKMVNWFNHTIIDTFIHELEERSDAQLKKVVETAMIYLQNNYMKDISLDSCADHTRTNSVVLSKLFKQVTGKNFIDYLTELRLDKAKELLRETDLKITDVAAEVGYQQTYFNRIFKKIEGVTPTQYREMSRGG
jgi:AraC-like DNA-binding protein